MPSHRLTALALSACLATTVISAGPAAAARSSKTASVDLAYTITDGRCYPTMTATWSGYQVNRVRFIGYREGHSGDDAAWLDTKSYPGSRSQSSGSMTSTVTIAAPAGEGWYAYAILRSNGGARLAEVWSTVVYAPAECLYP
jgi:hypothetical protein